MANTCEGQTTIEVALLLVLAAMALVAVAVYTQRAYQGYLYMNASSHGLQFDPEQPFTVSKSLNTFQRAQDITVEAGQQTVEQFDGEEELPSTPGGEVPGRIFKTTVKVDTNWDISRSATYEAR